METCSYAMIRLGYTSAASVVVLGFLGFLEIGQTLLAINIFTSKCRAH